MLQIGKKFKVGDKVIIKRRDHILWVHGMNPYIGTCGTIESIFQDSCTLKGLSCVFQLSSFEHCLNDWDD
jgi:hypothetical protein